MHRSQRWAIAILLPAIIIFGVSLSVYMVWPTSREELIAWEDDGTRYAVNARYFIAKTVTELTVSDEGGMLKKIVLDDDMRFRIIALAEYKEWVLVLNTQFVVGGYNRKTGELVGEGHWDELPFTVRIYSGTVVALNVVGKDILDPITPLHFPLIIDPVMQALAITEVGQDVEHPPRGQETVSDTEIE